MVVVELRAGLSVVLGINSVLISSPMSSSPQPPIEILREVVLAAIGRFLCCRRGYEDGERERR